MRLAVSTLSGVLFGLGLLISGMTDTSKVQGRLDLFGAWDPTLAFVLGGVVLPMIVVGRIAERRQRTLPGAPTRDIEGPLQKVGGFAADQIFIDEAVVHFRPLGAAIAHRIDGAHPRLAPGALKEARIGNLIGAVVAIEQDLLVCVTAIQHALRHAADRRDADPPAMKTSFSLGSRGRVNEPAMAEPQIVSPGIISHSWRLKARGEGET